MYQCPTCFEQFLFRPEVCPTCAKHQKKQSRARRAKERRARYDPVGKLATEEFWQLLRWFPCCPCCGRSWQDVGDWINQDHIIPISCGGVNTVANLQPLCQPCNIWKQDHLIVFNPQSPGRPAPLPQRLHNLFQQIPAYRHLQDHPSQQLELLDFDPHQQIYPHATPAQMQRATIQLTWEWITQGAPDDNDSATDPVLFPPHPATGH